MIDDIVRDLGEAGDRFRAVDGLRFVGQVGAGVLSAPIEPFEYAIVGLAQKIATI